MFSAPCDFVSTAPYSYKFGPSSGTALLTMTVADYSRQALLRQCCCIEVRESSSGKNAFFPTMYLLHLHLGFRVASGFILFSRLTHLRMPYAVSVRQVSGLPPASFRSRLAADTLALGYVLGATPCTRDFHPLERAHAERTKKSGKVKALPLYGIKQPRLLNLYSTVRVPITSITARRFGARQSMRSAFVLMSPALLGFGQSTTGSAVPRPSVWMRVVSTPFMPR